MTPSRFHAVLLVCALSCACIQIPELVSGTPPDAGNPDVRPVQLDWLSPASDTTTNGTLQIQVEVFGPAPDRVELLVDGVSVTTLESPYSWKWETWLASEGTHVLAVRALRNEQVFLSPARTVVVDRTRPRMIAQSPTKGASSVAVLTPIQATFSEPLDASTVNRQSIQLMTDIGGLEVTVLLSEDGRVLTLSPTSPLPVGQRVWVVLADTVGDFAGNRLESMFGDWEWFVPPYLQLGEPLLEGKLEESTIVDTSLRVGRDARPLMAWTQDSVIHAKRWTGDGWESLGGPLTAGSGNGLSGSVLQIDTEGRPMLAWVEFAGASQSQIHVRRWNGTAWHAMGSFLITGLSQAYVRWVGFSSGTRGLPVVAWHEENSTQSQIVLRQWDGSVWSASAAPLPLKKGATINYLGFDLDDLGRPVFSFTESEWNTSDVGRVMQWNGTSWTDLSAGLGGLPTSRVVDGDGKVVVGMSATVAGVQTGLVKKWDGGAWLPVGGPMGDLAGGTSRRVDAIAPDSQGRLVVLVSESPSAKESASRIGQTRRWTGDRWEQMGGVMKPPPGRLMWGLPDFALAGDDEPIVAWTEKVHPSDVFMSEVHVYRLNH